MKISNCKFPIPDAPPAPASSFYYGWVMLPLSMAALVASAPGQTFGVSIFNEPIRLSLGLDHSQLAAAYTLGTLIGAAPITYIGALMDRRGLRWTMLLVVTLFAAACLVTASAQNWFMLVAGFAMLRMLGPGALAFLSGNTLPFWFDRRLGLVEGFRQLSLAAAMGVVPALNLWLANRLGWRGAYALLGVGLWLLLFPAFTLLFRNRPRDVGQELDGARPNTETPGAAPDWSAGLTLGETLRAPAFWIAASATALFGLILTAMFFSLVPIFHERGLSNLEAASMVTFFAVSLAAWQLAGGFLADRLPAAWLMAAALAGLAVGMFALRAADSLLAAQLAGLVIGGAQGLFFGGTQPLWARYFGRLHLGKIRGVLMTITVAASSIGPLLAGLARDHFGNFNLILLLFALAPLPLAILALFARPPQIPARGAAARA